MKIVSTEISKLDSVDTKMGRKVEISLRLPMTGESRLQTLKSLLVSNGKGKYPLHLRIFHNGIETLVVTGMKVSGNGEIISRIEEIAGKGGRDFSMIRYYLEFEKPIEELELKMDELKAHIRRERH